MKLAELQQAFFTAVMTQQTLPSHFLMGNDEQQQQALQIYRDSIQGARLKSLEKVFPCCLALVGHDYFQQLALHYIATTPAMQPDINQAHQGFAAFIEQYAPAHSLPYLAEMAGFEYQWQQVFDQATTVTPAEDLSLALTIAADTIQLSLLPGIQLVSSQYPLIELRQLCLGLTSQELTLECYPRYYVIYRVNQQIAAQSLDFASWQIVQLLTDSLSLADLCQRYIEHYQTALDEKTLFDLLQQHIITWRLPQ